MIKFPLQPGLFKSSPSEQTKERIFCISVSISDILPHYLTCNKYKCSHDLSCDVIVQ